MSEKIIIRSTWITRILGLTGALLALASFIRLFIVYRVEPKLYPRGLATFNLDAENNLPILFSIGLLLLLTLILTCITSINYTHKTPHRFTWLLLTLISLLIAINKAVRFHGYITRQLIQIIRNIGPDVILYLIFVIIILAAIGLLILFYRFSWQFQPKIRRAFFIAAAIFLNGAVVLEMVGSSFYDPSGQNNLVYQILSIFEEALEMAGVIAFIRVLIIYISEVYTELHFHFDPE
jgi:hypothetical protein